MEQLAAIANGRPVREGRRWSRKEDQMMRRLKREGKSDFEIADQLSRAVGARRSKVRGASFHLPGAGSILKYYF